MASTLGKRGGRDVDAMVGLAVLWYLTLCSSKLKLSTIGRGIVTTDAEVGVEIFR